MRAIDKVFDKIRGMGIQIGPQRGIWTRVAHPCNPAGDQGLSLAIAEQADGTVLIKSHKPSYSTKDVLDVLGLEWKDLFPEDDRDLKWKDRRGRQYKVRHGYEYTSENGKAKGRVARAYEEESGDRQFPQFHYDKEGKLKAGLNGAPLPLYQVTHVKEAIRDGMAIHLVEGEKDTRNMWRAGYASTCKPGGAESPWDPSWVETLRGADLVCVCDKDYAGYKAGLAAKAALESVVESFRLVEAKAGKDSSDHLDAGFLPIDFVELTTAEVEKRVKDLQAEIDAEKIRKRSEQMDSQPERYGRVIMLNTVEAVNVDWIWDPYLARGFSCMVDGEKGIGKSFFMLALAAGITVGHFPGVEPFAPGRVLMLASEDPIQQVIVKRLISSMPDGVDLSKIAIIDDCPNFDDGGIEVLEARVQNIRPTLIIVDMLFGFTGSINVDSDPEAKGCMRELNRICDKYQACLMASRHPVKNWRDREPTHRGMGSQGWGGSAKLGFWVEEKAEEPGVRTAIQIKANIAPEFGRPIRYTLSKADGFQWDGWDEAPKVGGSRGPAPSKALAVRKAMIELLLGQTLPAKEAIAKIKAATSAGRTLIFEVAKSLDVGGDFWSIAADPFAEDQKVLDHKDEPPAATTKQEDPYWAKD